MKSGRSRLFGFNVLALLLPLIFVSNLFAQNSGTLRGKVSDPSGAVIPGATVTAVSSDGRKSTAVSDGQGAYEITGLAPGNYMLSTTAKGFASHQGQNLSISANQVQQFDIALEIQVKPEKVEVEESATTVNTSPSDNASSLVIKGKDLDALPDDPDELQSDLEALAGPSAGPNGGQIYIDGFTGGQLPPKSSIREIRINQNPFSAEYDKIGYGRIEIFTKPGSDQFHGQLLLNGNDAAFNSGNPFVSQQPPYHSEFFMGSISGPLWKKSSFFVDAMRRNINDSNVVNATVLDSNLQPAPFTQALTNPRTRTNIGLRLDFQLSKNNTLTVRYQYFDDSEKNQGVGQFSLPSQAFNSNSTEHTLQVSDTQVLSTNVINETRFQYLHENSDQTAQNFQPTRMVLGAFTGGGNQQGNSSDTQNHYEFQNYTSIVHGNHLIKFGARLRGLTDSNISNSNFNGVFTFSSINAYQSTLMGVPGAGPSQFSITRGQPLSEVSVVDAGLYLQDDWRIRPNITLSYGLRFETQNDIHDHGDFAPRLGFAWGLGRGKTSPKTVLRAGFGIFYDRFGSSLILQSERLNGITQSQEIVSAPDLFPTIPTGTIPGALVSPTSYQIAPDLHVPSTMQTAVSLERQLTKAATVAVTYLNSRGNHQLFIRNTNAPLPGTFDPAFPASAIRPLGGSTNIYQYNSEGIFRQNQLIANFRVSAGKNVSLFGFYTLDYANSDLGAASGSGSSGGFGEGGGGGSGATANSANFLSNQFDPMADYGRSAFDVRHRLVVGGTISLPYAFRLSPIMVLSSGQPFDITIGQDLNGDSIFNDRPGFVSPTTCATTTNLSATAVCTPLGTFNPSPAPGQALVPVNSGTGPTLFSLNLRVSKTFSFGPETKGASVSGAPGGHGGGRGPGGGGAGGGLGGRGLSGNSAGGGFFGAGGTTNRRFNLTFGVSGRNIFNRVNLAAPVGDLGSPLFGQSNALAGGPYSSAGASRRIDLQVLFSF